LFKKLKTWKFPKLDFEIDHGPENAAQVEKIIIEEIETPLSKRKKPIRKKLRLKNQKNKVDFIEIPGGASSI
jgi:hypothetical protein